MRSNEAINAKGNDQNSYVDIDITSTWSNIGIAVEDGYDEPKEISIIEA